MRILASQHSPGFSLIQISVVLLIAGIILASTLPGGSSGDDAMKQRITRERMQKIEDAVYAFMLKNNRRPCPANATYDISNVNFGKELSTPGTCSSPNFGPFTSTVGDDTTTIVTGMVPTRDLNLPDEYALDGYGRRFMYTVDTKATSTSGCRDMHTTRRKGLVGILDARTATTPADYVMGALLSYGKDGHGAFPADGSTVANRINTYTSNEDTNYNAFVTGGATFLVLTYAGQLVRAAPYEGFDDIVWYNESTKNTCCVGLRCNQGFKINTAASSLETMQGVTYAVGDVNGDGFKDIVYANHTRADKHINIILGTNTGWPVPPTAYSGTPNFVITNDYANSYTGYTITVGDATNDGKDDILINSAGKAFIIYDLTFADGSPEYFMTDLVTNFYAAQIVTYTPGGLAPGSVAIGDVDNDGYKDLIISNNYIGYIVLVVWGRANGTWPTSIDCCVTGDPAYVLAMIRTPSVNWGQGTSSIGVGDTNGDTYGDIVIGTPLDNGNKGMVNVFYGRSRANWIATVNSGVNRILVEALLSDQTNSVKFISSVAGDGYVGQSVAVGDYNHDGYADFIFASSRSIFGVLGSSVKPAAGDNNVPATANFRINIRINQPVAANGLENVYNTLTLADVNGDSYQDIILTCPNTYFVNSNSGTSYVFFQPTTTTGWASDSFGSNSVIQLFSATDSGYTNFNGRRGFIIEGASSYYSTARAIGDVNNDKIDDILVGAPGSNSNGGGLYVIYGRRDTPWHSRQTLSTATPASFPYIDLTDIDQ